jgi:hypothetical protein
MVLGAYGANAVHFAWLQMYLAGRLGVEVGTYTQISNNYHCYQNSKISSAAWEDPYSLGAVTVFNMFQDFDVNSHFSDEKRDLIILEDLSIFFDKGAFVASTKTRWPYLRKVLVPLALAHAHWKTNRGEDRYLGALEILAQVRASDWRLAGEQWIGRRHAKWKIAADSGVSHDQ